ncbi:MAG: glycoside hydrolase family 127 protein [Planctomycetota bacterium]
MRRTASTPFPAAALALALLVFLLAGPLSADAPRSPDPTCKVAPVIPIRAYAFDLRDVRLLEGPFRRALELDQRYLLALELDRLLHNFRVNAGLPSSAQPLGGWEAPDCELRGHFVGHFLSACALIYAATGDDRLKDRADTVVAALAKCQESIGSGYLSAFPESFIDRVERRERVWAPWYTLHKIYAGLLDTYVHLGNSKALEVAERMALWAKQRTGMLSDEAMQRMLDTEHGGMNETLANLYALTGKQEFLELALRFNHNSLIDPASRREDNLTGLHANTQIPKFIGAARLYELTGAAELRTAATFFWEVVTRERSYVIGGHSDGEAFSPKETLSQALGPSTAETCNTYNMLKLTRHLFCWDPQAAYADYYERALLNHILASQDPSTGMMCYYVPLRSGSCKEYNTPNDSFWCCTGTGVENHAKYGDSIYFHDGMNTLFVNLFIASELRWREKGLTLRQETHFPEEGLTRLTFTCPEPVALELKVRHPDWALAGIDVALNGRKLPLKSLPGAYVSVSRTWKSGDNLEVRLPMTLRCEGFRDNPRRIAFLHGPLVLCAEIAPPSDPPVIVAGKEEDVAQALQPIPGRPSTFAAPAGLFRRCGGAGRVFLEPFSKMHGGRHYAVYWDRVSEEEWRERVAAYEAAQARQRELEARTVDQVLPGDPSSENAHRLQGSNTSSGLFMERHWRHATDGGWFSYELEVEPEGALELLVTYWGSDSGRRVFDVLVEGTRIATQNLQDNRPGVFYDEVYAIPDSLTRGKSRVTVRFQAHAGAWAGGVFACRVLRR